MFSYDFYKVMHFLGLFMIFSALGGQFVHALNGGDPKQLPGRRWIGIFHGVGLLLAIVAGFGLLAKLQLGVEPWVIGKILVWVALGGIGAIVKKKRGWAGVIWMVTIVLGMVAAYLARVKPTF